MTLKRNRPPSAPLLAKAVRFCRRLRGGAQAQLLETAGGHCYVTKFLGNPQHRRILVNDWLCSRILRHLRLSTPEIAIVEVDGTLIASEPRMSFQLAKGLRPVTPGLHFGSAYPGNPDTHAVFDFLPDTLLDQVVNLSDFLGACVVDKWICTSDSRQAIFFYARPADWISGFQGNQKGYVMQLIDHGFAFDGAHWEFMDSPLQGLYARKRVYAEVTDLASFQPWLSRVENFPPEVLYRALAEMPREWLAGDQSTALRLVDHLLARRSRVAGLLEAAALGPKRPFANWGASEPVPQAPAAFRARGSTLALPVLAN